MIKLIGRMGARLGASALVAAAGLAVTALPASAAAGVDLTVAVQSGVVAEGSAGKPFIVKVTNVGDTKTTDGFDFVLDTAKIDASKVTVTLDESFDEFCEAQGTKFVCAFGNVVIKNDSLDLPVTVVPVKGAPNGAAGSFAVAVDTDADSNKGNNTATVPVSVSQPGVDIVVWAGDVTAGRDDETGEARKVAPGATADLEWVVANDGSLAADSVEFTITLPEHVSLVGTQVGCTVAGQKVNCVWPEALKPHEYLADAFPVKVAADAPSVDLKGTLEGHSVSVSTLARQATPATPDWAKAADFNPNEVDNKDNTDEYVVFVRTGGSGGGLPITGPKAIVIGGVGAAVLAVGLVLLLSARRRRVLLVTPAE